MKKSNILALFITLALCMWMLSGNFKNDAQSTGGDGVDTSSAPLFKVAVQTMTAQQTPLYVTSNGQVEPNRVLQVRAQTEGLLASVNAKEGMAIEKGDSIARIEIDERQLLLAEQEALLQSRQRTYERLQRLAQQNYQSQSELDQALAMVKASEAAIERIRVDIARTNIVAPFSGVLETMLLEQGDFVQVNTPVAVLLEQNPLVVSVNVAQQNINRLRVGTQADIELSTGQSAVGEVRYISPRANEQTRTFLVEIEIDNTDGSLKSGMSAKAKIATEIVDAHFVSPALFSLNEKGEIGVKTVSSDNRVEFYSVDILQSDSNGAWVSGLPKQADVIVSGQGFVIAGSEVRVEQSNTMLGSTELVGASQ
ncbi:efflux RND transporter periplasmic adaptor subunit [Glaciecola sp. XM2]|uniref:efflux RND transporter periplasmic adaptor subunit n=1 Tax=Glaciecola sp. XM2 TaxID=1914931 RepID=UPI001BDF08AE|nr:efflux RND transporter periplasmic adaptor subunit [Glaciecola sp. XM2]MBT1452442.1 efflux RND transporter periplasmic adaptor subunit [Glaciecola sp. XM2]